MPDEDLTTSEEDILNNPALVGSIEASSDGDMEDGDGTADPTPSGDEGTQAPTPDATEQQTGTSTVEGAAAEQVVEQAPVQRPTSTRLTSDDKGNLVDSGGKIVAAAGSERRLFETNQNLRRDVQTATQQVQELRTQLQVATQSNQQVQTINGMPQQLGLSPDDTVLGLNLIANFRKNPIETLKYILTEAKANGHNLEGIDGGALDVGAVKSMITEALQPFTADREAENRQEQINTGAQRDYQAFMQKFPDARHHEDLLANMLTRDVNMAPETAYWQLLAWTNQHGLDISQPLKPQMEARQAQGGNGNAPQTRPMVVGGQAPTQQTTVADKDIPIADATVEFDDIIAEAMREHGLNPTG